MQGLPLRVKSSGSAPTDPEALNPKVMRAPGAIVEFHDRFFTETAAPDCAWLPLHRLVTFSVPANDQRRSQPVTGVVPVF